MTKPTLPDDRMIPHPDHLSPRAPGFKEIVQRHAEAVQAGKALYEDPITGLWVMTAATLWDRSCCRNGCRHCPHVDRDGPGVN